MQTYKADVLIDRRFALSEGPVWDERDQSLHFVDIKNNRVYRYELASGGLTSIDVCQNVGCFALRESGGYILGLTAGVYLINAEHNKLEKLPQPVTDPMTRFNDGKCDPQGRFWCGMADLYGFGDYNGGRLYVISPDHSCATIMDGLSCSNGLGFDKSGRTMYFIDSTHHQVESYTLNPDSCAVSNMRVVTRIDRSVAVPDGMTMDEDGKLWVAHWGAGFVGRYDPKTGALLCKVEVDATQSSSCCFGGEDMQTLFITSGHGGESEEHGGCVFSAHLPYRGVPSYRYLG